MSVSNADYGVCKLDSDDVGQFVFKSTNETTYTQTLMTSDITGWFIGALGQDADRDSDASGDWTSNAFAPFPGQCTTVMFGEGANPATKTLFTLETANMELRVLYQTIMPIFDDSAGMWQDLKAQVVTTSDFFITATSTEMNNLDARIDQCTANTMQFEQSSIAYYQIQLLSADYFAAGSVTYTDQGDGAIFIAWDTGTAIW